jgi:hypothetical protein
MRRIYKINFSYYTENFNYAILNNKNFNPISSKPLKREICLNNIYKLSFCLPSNTSSLQHKDRPIDRLQNSRCSS